MGWWRSARLASPRAAFEGRRWWRLSNFGEPTALLEFLRRWPRLVSCCCCGGELEKTARRPVARFGALWPAVLRAAEEAMAVQASGQANKPLARPEEENPP